MHSGAGAVFPPVKQVAGARCLYTYLSWAAGRRDGCRCRHRIHTSSLSTLSASLALLRLVSSRRVVVHHALPRLSICSYHQSVFLDPPPGLHRLHCSEVLPSTTVSTSLTCGLGGRQKHPRRSATKRTARHADGLREGVEHSETYQRRRVQREEGKGERRRGSKVG
ncbi:hypothetical protein B0H11DRAFT_630041 [Mycena galericulata]|nr:hypothetical protein B0H11DRAFT_630041 [Mycena galericulata]